jgi:AsmA family protein
MRFLKAALIAFAVAIVVAVGAGAYLLSRIDEGTLAREAQAVVKKATGRTLDIGGKIDLRISFTPAIVAESVRFSNASWGSRPDMARARRIEVELDLIPLIRGTVRVDRLVVVEPEVLLETDAKGRANWDFDLREATDKTPDTGTSLQPAIETGALRISDGVLVYRDGKRGTTTRIEIKALDFREAMSGRLRSVAMNGRINRRAFELKGTVGDPATLLAPGGAFPLDLNITAELARVGAKGQLIDALGRADAQLQVQIEAAEVQDLAALVDRQVPPLGPLKARAMIERDNGRLGLRDLDLTVGRPGALHARARGSIRDLVKPAGAALEFGASAPKTEHAPAFGASGRVEDFKEGVRVSGLRITSGANELKGAFEYRSGKERAHVVTRLEGASLDLGFLAAARDHAPSGGPVFARERLALGRLRALDADARISLGALVLPNRVTLRSFAAQLELRGGRLRADPVEFLAGGGRTTTALTVDASGEAASWSARLEGRRIVLGDLLASTPLGDKIKGGATDIDFIVTTRGNSPHDWAAGLNGNVRIVVGEARIKAREINLGSDALTRILEAINPFRKTDPEVELQCVVLRLPIAEGVARSDRGVGMESNKMSALSSGTIDLGKEVMDINVRPRVKEGIGLGGARLAQMVRVTGPLTDPKLGLDFGGVVGTTASIAAGVATGGLSLLGEQLLKTATAENACKVALGSASTRPAGSTGAPGRTEQPADEQPAAKEPPAKKEQRGLIERIFGN